MPDWEDLPLLSDAVAQRADDAGNILGANPIDAASVNIDPRISDFILYGVFNGAFARGPVLGLNSYIGDDNPLPDWTGPTQVSGGAITCQWVADSSSPSGYNLRFNIAAGAAGDEAYVEQIVPVGGDRAQRLLIAWATNFYRVSASGGTPRGTWEFQFLKADNTTTGTAVSSSLTLSGDATLYDTSTAGMVPTDAVYVRMRLGVRRNTMAATDSALVDLLSVRSYRASSRTRLPDNTDSTATPGLLYQDSGSVYLIRSGTGTSATSRHISIGSTDLYFQNGNVSYALLDGNGFAVGQVPLLLNEQAAPATPSSGFYSLYPKTDGILYGKNDSGTETPLGGGFPGSTPTFVRPTITANQNNYGPTGLANRVFLEIDCNGSGKTITGWDASLFLEGHIFFVRAIGLGAGVLTISHHSASSSAGNRIKTPNSGAAFTIDFNDIACFVYLPTLDSTNPFMILSSNRI